MKIGCWCGEVIRDQTDDIPYKAYYIAERAVEELDALVLTIADAIIALRHDPTALIRWGEQAWIFRTDATLETLISDLNYVYYGEQRKCYRCEDCGRIYLDYSNDPMAHFIPINRSNTIFTSVEGPQWGQNVRGIFYETQPQPHYRPAHGTLEVSGLPDRMYEEFETWETLQQRYTEVYTEYQEAGRVRSANLRKGLDWVHSVRSDQPRMTKLGLRQPLVMDDCIQCGRSFERQKNCKAYYIADQDSDDVDDARTDAINVMLQVLDKPELLNQWVETYYPEQTFATIDEALFKPILFDILNHYRRSIYQCNECRYVHIEHNQTWYSFYPEKDNTRNDLLSPSGTFLPQPNLRRWLTATWWPDAGQIKYSLDNYEECVEEFTDWGNLEARYWELFDAFYQQKILRQSILKHSGEMQHAWFRLGR